MKGVRDKFQINYLIGILEKNFKNVPSYCSQSQYSLSDCLLSAFAIFHLKFPSLLSFDEAYKDRKDEVVRHNLKTLYRVSKAPSDTTLRERLDGVSPSCIKECLRDFTNLLQREKVLDQWSFMGHKLISVDGTGFFTSSKIHCNECCTKKDKDGNVKSYYHQMLVGSIVHPHQKHVFPVLFEPICKKDGEEKNDCERNAMKRFLKQYRIDHPNMPTIILADGLSSNAPYIQELQKSRCKFILGCKETDHAFLAQWFFDADKKDAPDWCVSDDKENHRYRYMKDVPLNESNFELKVNVLFYEKTELKTNKKTKWMWVTDLEPTQDNMKELVKAGRSRWKIENETFNTLKNQGYEFEHNFGHGYKTLSNLFAGIMLLAFLVDQILFALDLKTKQCLEKKKRLYRLRDVIRMIFFIFCIEDWDMFYRFILAPPRFKVT